MNDTRARTLYLIDGTAQLFRAYFAIPGLTDERGMPTHAIYGFTTMLRKLLREEQPTHVAAAFDLGGDVFRHASFAAYKANRPPVPEDLHVQVPYAKRVCEALGVRVVEREGFEADDLIATYTRRARALGYPVVVVAADKDLMQLVGSGVTLLNPTKNLRLDARGVADEFGVPPERVRDVLGLMGDAVDNIPGVPGVGEKTALSLVRAHGDLESVLERAERTVALFEARDTLVAAIEALAGEAAAGQAIERIRGAAECFVAAVAAFGTAAAPDDLAEQAGALAESVRATDLPHLPLAPADVVKRLRTLKRDLKGLDRGSARRIWQALHDHREAARLSRTLATLHDDVPIEVEIDELERGAADPATANALFASLGFRSLVDDSAAAGPDLAAASGTSGALAAYVYEHVTDREALARIVASVGAARRVALRVSIRGEDRLAAPLEGLALAWAEGSAAYVAVGAGGVSLDELRRALGGILAGRAAPTLTHDAKRHAQVLWRHGLPFDARGLDLMVAAFLLDPGRSDYSAERLGADIGGLAARPPALESLDPAAAIHARAEDADRLMRVAARIEPQLDAAGLRAVYDRIDGPLLPVLARMEARGIRIDVERLARDVGGDGARSSRASARRSTRWPGVQFNVDSPKQLREVLFGDLGLASGRKTAKSGEVSTDAQTLEELADEHEIARKLLEYRELAKLKGTYVDTLPRLVDPETGRVHTSFDPTGAATGRLSSSDPNLQNIPVRTEAGRQIRGAFVPEPGWVFLASDYSQIELRVLAHLASDDPELIAAFRAGEDIHRVTAARVFGVARRARDRRDAPARQGGQLRHPLRHVRDSPGARAGDVAADARRFIEAYFERFRGVRRYIDETRRAGAARRARCARCSAGSDAFPSSRGGRGARSTSRRCAPRSTRRSRGRRPI